MKYLSLVMVFLFSVVASASVDVLSTTPEKKLIRVSYRKHFSPGDLISIHAEDRAVIVALAKVKSCKPGRGCLCEMIETTESLPIEKGNIVRNYYRNHIILFGEKSVGSNFGVGYQRKFKKGLWRFGINYRKLKDNSKQIGLDGYLLSIEGQKRFLQKNKLEAYYFAELGKVSLDLDFTSLNSNEGKIKGDGFFGNFGLGGRYNFKPRFGVFADVGLGMTTLKSKYTGTYAIYKTEFDAPYPLLRAGLIYSF